MRHVVVGAGGVGGLIAGALAKVGEDVMLLVRPGTAASYPPRLRVESAVMGTFDVAVPVVETTGDEFDVAWFTVKATQLGDALRVHPAARAVIPLLNGIDHVGRLRDVYGDVVIPAAIRVESARRAPGDIVQPGPFVAIDLAASPELHATAEAVRASLEEAGAAASVQDSEADVLWRKLAIIAPIALATSSARGPIGAVREDPELERLMTACAREVCRVAFTQGATLDEEQAVQAMSALPDAMHTSMERDVVAGNEPELDAIAGPILRIGAEQDVPTPATAELTRRVRENTTP